MMQSRSRATLSYRPQANGQQGRSVKTVIQSVRVYVEDPLQQDWDEIVERLVDSVLLGAWMGSQSTVKAMSASLRRGLGRQSNALAWRREVNRQQEIALTMAKEIDQETSSSLAWTLQGQDSGARIVFAYELELPDKSSYRFYPVVHVLRLKAVNEFGDRPKTRLAPNVADDSRFDFDEELLPENSWEPDRLAGEYEVEAILDDRTPLSTGTKRSVREFKVKWVGYDEPTWEPASNLSCGGLLYDFLRSKRSERRLQMVQVSDED
ncbi:unnamed protein product [Phytophthora lilii]|uniref:Unnamed protein product n=1 Tax=Phytophthora lilii TaxID=2077276 RepID=A0A9W6TDP5_9STRA|nr:unnamed protein product [Phytophthora lilii]